MITHEEARESYKRLFESYLDGDWAPFPTRSDLDTYRDYITQQEKKDKLLELYRKHMTTLWKNAREGVKDSMFRAEHIAYETYQQIQALEEELK